jgi:SAM-dependent methyltransferase
MTSSTGSYGDAMTESGDPERVPCDDPYARVDYRRLIAWGPRIEREGPFLLRLLGAAPDPSVLDAGCGTGEHTAFFAGRGCRAVGLDRSEAMLAKAREHEAAGAARFVLGDVLDARTALADEAPFGLAVCLGNMLPHLHDVGELERFVRSMASVLLPDGILLVQLLNYRRILDQEIRHLPLNFRPGEGQEEVVFLRLMRPGPDGTLSFFPTSLVLDPEAQEPVKVTQTRRVDLRPWTVEDLEPVMRGEGFVPAWHGDMAGGPYDPQGSADLVVVARRTCAQL